MRWKPFTPGTPYTCNDCPALAEMRADRDRWFKLADGMAGCLDSSTEAGDLLADYEQASRGE